jgi:hypothetical protein
MHVAALGNLFDDEEPTEPRVNDELAMRVESAVIATGPVHSRALTMHYVERAPAAVIGRQLGLRDPAPVLERAHAEVARRLR